MKILNAQITVNENSCLAQDNLGLVHLCANRFRGKGIEYEELYSAGCIGLVKAQNAFDSERGVRFSTYAVPVILGEIKRLFRDGGQIKVSRSVKELSMRLMREKERYSKQYSREPAIEELAQLCECTVEAAAEALNVSMPLMSLTAVSGDGASQTDIPVDAPDEQITDILSLRQVISELDADDRRLIYLRYFRNKTQSQTAQVLGMTQVQVSRREKKLLDAMKKKLLCL